MNKEWITTLEDLTKEIKEKYLNRTEPEQMYNALKSIIDGYAQHSIYSSDRGMLRNIGVEEICKQLNDLQKESTFQDKYQIIYQKMKKGIVRFPVLGILAG